MPRPQVGPDDYAFTFQAAAGNGDLGEPTAVIQKKRLGTDLLNATTTEADDDPLGVVPVRLQMRMAYADDDRHGRPVYLYEIVDWQVRDADGGWSPWRGEVATAP